MEGEHGQTAFLALLDCVKRNDVESLSRLWDEAPVRALLTKAKDQEGRTALHWASGLGYAKLVSQLIKMDADVNQQDEGGMTPVAVASVFGNLECVRVLLEADVSLPVPKPKEQPRNTVELGKARQHAYRAHALPGPFAPNVSISPDRLQVHNETELPQTVLGNVAVAAGRYYYEVELLTDGCMKIGWARKGETFDLSKSLGVGNTLHSFAYDGFRGRAWNVVFRPFGQGRRWSRGSVVGVGVDWEEQTVSYSLNGVDLGDAFIHLDHENNGAPLVPAVTVDRLQSFRFVFSEEELKYRPQRYTAMESNALKMPFDGMGALHAAAFGGHLSTLINLLAAGHNPGGPDLSGRTPLHYACLGCSSRCAKALLDNDARLAHAVDSEGETALHCCAQNVHGLDHTETVDVLLKHGASVQAFGATRWSPLHYSAFNGLNATTGALLEALASEQDGTEEAPLSTLLVNWKGRTPVHVAASVGALPVLRTLLFRGRALGARVHVEDINASTALHDAAWNGHTKCAQLLLACGAKVLSEDKEHGTPFHDACWNGSVGVAKLLLEHVQSCSRQKETDKREENEAETNSNGNGRELSPERSQAGDTDREEEEEEERGTRVSASPSLVHNILKNGLRYCLRRGQRDAARFLIVKGADVNERDSRGYTALHWAVCSGNTSCIPMLLDCGAEVNFVNEEGQSILHYACRDSSSCARLLLERGAKALVRDRKGNGPIHWAACRGRTRCVELLVEHGEDADASNNEGVTPLMFACREAEYDVVRSLLSKDADINARDNKGNTALHWMAKHWCAQHMDVLDLLIERNAPVTSTNSKGLTPCDIVEQQQGDAGLAVFREKIDNPQTKRGGSSKPRKKAKKDKKNAGKKRERLDSSDGKRSTFGKDTRTRDSGVSEDAAKKIRRSKRSRLMSVPHHMKDFYV